MWGSSQCSYKLLGLREPGIIEGAQCTCRFPGIIAASNS